MNKFRKLASTAAMAMAVAALVSASAFAEQRHDDRTRDRDDRDRGGWREGRGDRSVQQHGDDHGYYGRESRDSGRYRDSRREPYYAHGRVTRVEPYRGDYRVWVGGSRYPFHVPASHYRRNRWGVGVEIRIGGIYNPAGYYDYYEDGRYRDRRRNDYVRGTVIDVDRNSFVLRDDRTDERVRIALVGRDRTFDHLRRGDYVEVLGDWNGRIFDGYRADILDSRRDRRW